METQIPKTYTDLIGTEQTFNGNLFTRKESVKNEVFTVVDVRFSDAFIISMSNHCAKHPAIELLLKNDRIGRAKWSRPFAVREITLVSEESIKVGVKVDTIDGNDGVIVEITKGPLPYLVQFKHGSAYCDLQHIKRIL